MNIGIIIQARLGSSRLPGKSLMHVDSSYSVLEYVVNQLKHSKFSDKIFVATTINPEDDRIISVTNKLDVTPFRGSPDNVLDRYYSCAKTFSLDIIVRITADNPLIDPQILDNMMEQFLEVKPDYSSNAIDRTFPFGTEIEIFNFKTLEYIWKNAKRTYELEHVTIYIINNPQKFKILSVKNSSDLSHLRWTVDRKNDLELVRLIAKKIKNRPILLEDILHLFDKEPNLKQINKNNIPDDGYLKSLENEKMHN
jgi:spore coat polysaccharide biosynthesis protein SpsF